MIYNQLVLKMLDYQPKLTRKLIYIGLKVASRCIAFKRQCKPVVLSDDYTKVMGLRFTNKYGIAAGFDRHGATGRHFGHLGFGHVEIGTLTRRPQSGHNRGIDILQHRPVSASATILGINIGLNNDATSVDACNDLLYCLTHAWCHGDYIAINFSSPATRSLMMAENKPKLTALLIALKQQQLHLQHTSNRAVPIAIKIALSSKDQYIPELVKQIKRLKFEGLIVAIDSHKASASDQKTQWQADQQQKACELIRRISHYLNKEVGLISVGGLLMPHHIKQRLDAGADLIQLHNGLILQAPTIIKYISSQ